MSPTLAPPPARQRRPLLPPLFRDPENRSVQIGIAATLLLHLLFLLFAPRLLSLGSAHAGLHPAATKRFNIHLTRPPPPPRPPLPQQYVEANPNANSKVPPNTRNFSFMNQQAAQEKPTPNGHSDRPAMDGRKDIKSNQIVTGQLTKPELAPPPAPVVPKSAPTAHAAPKREQTPLSGFAKDVGTDAHGFGSNLAKPSDQANPSPNQVTGTKEAPPDDNATTEYPQIDPNHPQPRASLEQHVRPAILSNNQFGTANIGVRGLDARWSSYGEYLHKMTEIIQVEWDRILDNSRVYPPSGTSVTVKFRLDSKGRIVEIVEHTGNSSEQGTEACIAAITNPSPYGPWTDDMIAMLGHDQVLIFTFYYE